MEDSFLKRLNTNMKNKGYSTKTEFIREALREKLEADERELLITEFMKFKGKAKKSTTPTERAATREKAFITLARENGWSV